MPPEDKGGTQPPKTRGPLPGHASDPAAAAAPRAARFVSTKVEVEGREETKIVELPSIDMPPWEADAELHVVGQRIERMDALEKVTGRARYTADVQRPGMLHAVLVRAPVARGRVTRLDLAPALAIPGVRGALLHDDVNGIVVDGVQLFDQSIRYALQPLAAICAESLDAALRARQAVITEVESEPPVLTPEAALAENAPRVRAKGANHPRTFPRVNKRGDADAGLAEADVVIEREFETPVALHTALEPHGGCAEWSGGRVTVWESTQGVFNTRADLARAFGVPLSGVRVIKNYMGGGFGAKNGAGLATYVAVALAKKLGVPVRCILDREGEQADAGNRPRTRQRVTMGAKRDGTLTAIRLDATIPLGVSGWMGGPAKIYHELYRCPNVHTTEQFVFVNTAAMSSFRAPGHVEGAFGLERAMDILANALGMDPLELRRRNYAEHDQEKNRRYSAKRLDACYAAGAERFGWDSATGPGARGTRAGGDSATGTAGLHAPIAQSPNRPIAAGRLRRGVGMSSLVWGAGGGPPAYATVRINPDGSIDVLTGAQDLGTGSRTIFAQVAAESLGAKVEHVRTILGDTERLPFASNSWGSITTASVAPAVRVAAEEARRTLFDAAAAMLAQGGESLGRDDLESRDSVVRVRGTDRAMTFAEIGGRLGDVMIIGQGSRGPNPDQTSISAFGAQFAEVEVDVETGIVRVLRIVSAHDSGRIINPTLAESQLEGGILQGVGYALFEERVLDPHSGLPLNPTMHDYKIPTLADVPAIEAFCLDGADTVANHTGAKGLAEPPIIATAPAIANAVAAALGAEVNAIPLTPWRVLWARDHAAVSR